MSWLYCLKTLCVRADLVSPVAFVWKLKKIKLGLICQCRPYLKPRCVVRDLYAAQVTLGGEGTGGRE